MLGELLLRIKDLRIDGLMGYLIVIKLGLAQDYCVEIVGEVFAFYYFELAGY